MKGWSRAWLIAAVVALMATVIACEHEKPLAESWSGRASVPGTDGIIYVASPPTPPSSEAEAEAGSIFNERCAVCHGDNGEGNGPGADNLNPKPVNFHNQKWQQSISDKQIAKAIVYGGQAVGLSASMAPNPDLESKPETVAALVERIRKLGK
jgi:cytochrome c553